MALTSTISHLKDLLSKISQDIHKAEGGNKAASQRVRTNTVKLEKIGKTYRKESIHSEKNTKGKKPAKKAAHKPAAKKSHAPAKKAHAKKPAAKAKSATARPRALAFKKPTAKLPVKKSFR